MYSTWVSECRVPLMNVTAEMIGQSPWARTTSSAPRPLSVVIIVASGKWPSSVAAAASRPGALVATIPSSNGGSSAGSSDAVIRAWRSLRPLITEPVGVERVCVIATARQHAHLGDLREMAREQAADHASADDANTLDHPVPHL